MLYKKRFDSMFACLATVEMLSETIAAQQSLTPTYLKDPQCE